MRVLRRLLAGTLLLGMVGTSAELLLIGHFESAAQYAPLVLLAAGLASFVWHLAAPSSATVLLVRVVMVAFVGLGVVGIGLHINGNRAFELEMYPERSGWSLVAETVTGATPVLAPGAMTLLGLIGLAQTHHHPLTRRNLSSPIGVETP